MRIKVTIKTSKLPIIYNHRFISLIKEALKRNLPEYKENLYSKKQARQFTFAVVLPSSRETREEDIKIDNNFTIKEKVFYFNDDLSLFVSSSDQEFMINLYNGLLKLRKFRFTSSEGGMWLNGDSIDLDIKKVSLLTEKEIKDNKIIFKTNSPVIIEDDDDKPIHYEESDKVNLFLNKTTNKIFKTLFDRELKSELCFKTIKVEKQVVKHTLKEFREKTKKPIMYLTGFRGIFELSGHPEDLDLIYKIGLGNRTSQGFGMIEVIG